MYKGKDRGDRKFFDRDKLQIVFYVDVTGIDGSDIPTYMEEISNSFGSDESVSSFFIPTKGQHYPMVEFHWPPYDTGYQQAYTSNYVETND